MSKGINKAIIIGNLGADPETRYTPNNTAVCNITVATSDQWKDKKSGEQKEKTEWHRVVMFNRLGEIAGEYLKKGAKVYIEGRLQTRKWQDKDGHDRYTTEIVANEMQMLGGKYTQSGSQNAQSGYQTNGRQESGSGDNSFDDSEVPFRSIRDSEVPF